VLTLVLQSVITALILVMAYASLRAYAISESSAQPEHRSAWLLAGTAFAMHGLDKTVQEVLGGWAYAAGRESAAMARYMTVAPAFDHSRTLLLLAFCLMLAWFSVRKVELTASRYRVCVAILLAAAAVGAWIGIAGPRFTALTHFTAVAQGDVIEMVVLLLILFAALLSGRIDRVLWFLLAVYATSLAFNGLWFAAFSRADLPNEWVPAPWVLQACRTVLYAVMAALALYRLREARRARPVRALIDLGPSYTSSLAV
jgi:hypothetical protein